MNRIKINKEPKSIILDNVDSPFSIEFDEYLEKKNEKINRV